MLMFYTLFMPRKKITKAFDVWADSPFYGLGCIVELLNSLIEIYESIGTKC